MRDRELAKKMWKIVCISDTHQKHRKLEIPNGDILLCGGDFSWRGGREEVVEFSSWLSTLNHPYKILIAGNHETTFDPAKPEFDPGIRDLIQGVSYLENTSVEIEGLKIWGSPYSSEYCNWAFSLKTAEDAEAMWARIPDDTDVVLIHGPPYGIGDELFNGSHVGCRALLARLMKIQPRLVVSGHFHAGYGLRQVGKTTFVNAACVDVGYTTVNQPIVVEVERKTK